MSKKPLPTKLLAKSRREGREELTLQQHLLDTEQASEQIFRLDGRWGNNWCGFFKIEDLEARQRFLINLRVAALFHDLGKANEDFYNAVTQPGIVTQTLRHEHISALLLQLPALRSWLSANTLLDLDVITAAVLSHHIKASSESGDWKWCQPRNKKELQLYLGHTEVGLTLSRVAKIAGLACVPDLPLKPWSEASPWLQAWQEGMASARRFGREIRINESRRSLLLAVKTGLIVADAVASGLVREGYTINDWINEVVHSSVITDNSITAAIVAPRIAQIKKVREFSFHSFQLRTAVLGSRALLLAACGSGKTMAAWKWAEAQAREHSIGRVIFLYPTRGTATEGFRDYVGWAPETEGALVHSTARYELEAMMSNPSEATRDKSHQLSETEQRLFALGLWSRRYFSATADQFLSFLEHNYTSLCLLPLLADSAVIIDEVHSFDRHMFNNLISFLQTFNVPVLCMTATLPPSRRAELVRAGLKVYPTPEDRSELADLEKKENQPRYCLELVADESVAFQRAVSSYRNGERVLWVVNTVSRCQSLARRLSAELGFDVLAYHSRFRLKDRQVRHEKTVKAFQQCGSPAIAVTTQVCEMSLDLDADLLVSELAPITALVQRFGRANRHLARGEDFRASLCVYSPVSVLPYSKKEFDQAAAFMRSLGNRDISQRALAEKLESYALDEPTADGSARLLEGGYFATPGAFRDIDEFTHPAILDGDLADIHLSITEKKPYDGYVINVPRRLANGQRPDWLPKYLGVASASYYHELYGFQAEEEEHG